MTLGGGQWRRATWDQALDYIADVVEEVKAFMAAVGSGMRCASIDPPATITASKTTLCPTRKAAQPSLSEG